MSVHVLQLGPYPPPEGGISRNMLAIRDEVLRRGGRSSIIATSKSSRVNEEPGVYHPRSAVEMMRLLSSLSFDVLHIHIGGDISRRVLSLAAAAAFWGRGRCVLTIHSGAFPLTKAARKARRMSFAGAVFRRFSRIIAVNEAIADVFVRYGVDRERVSMILPFAPAEPDQSVRIPTEINAFMAEHSPLLLSVGGLERDYDPLFQIGALGRLIDRNPMTGLLLVGDGSLRDEVMDAAERSGYGKNILIAGNVEHAVTLHLIERAAVMLRTTLFDGDAISVREALFLGTPVIATDNGMRPDGVDLIGSNDADDLARAVERAVAGGRRERQPVGKSGSNIARVVDIYEEIVNSNSRASRSDL